MIVAVIALGPTGMSAHENDYVLLPFGDVHPNDWFYQPVQWAFETGIVGGISKTEFAPHADMTRAMLVTVLWRYAGKPVSGDATFADVESDAWYNAAIAWAAECGIVSGYNETTFGPNDPINREQMYSVLFRYMHFAGLIIKHGEETRLRQFADDEEISAWARDALYFMYNAGVMYRLSTLDNSARPKETALRGEIAGAMYFFNMYAVSTQQHDLFKAEYIRINWIEGRSDVNVINSVNEYIKHANQTNVVGAAIMYTELFFMQKYLVIVSLEESSGSIRHRVDNVHENGEIIITRLIPEIGTADMAGWDIIIELDKEFTADTFSVVIIDEHI